MQGPIQVAASFLMHRNPVGPRLAELGNKKVRIFDHQMAIERQLGRLPQRLHQRRPHGEVGDKVAVHNIHMDDRATASRGIANLVRQVGEISRQNRGCEFDQPGFSQITLRWLNFNTHHPHAHYLFAIQDTLSSSTLTSCDSRRTTLVGDRLRSKIISP